MFDARASRARFYSQNNLPELPEFRLFVVQPKMRDQQGKTYETSKRIQFGLPTKEYGSPLVRIRVNREHEIKQRSRRAEWPLQVDVHHDAGINDPPEL